MKTTDKNFVFPLFSYTSSGQMETVYLHLMAETLKAWKEIQQDTYQNSATSVGLNTL